MRTFNFGAFPDPEDDAFRRWVKECFAEIEQASFEGVETIADAFTVTNVTETRTLDCATATATDVANVLGTFLQDMKNRGAKSGF